MSLLLLSIYNNYNSLLDENHNFETFAGKGDHDVAVSGGGGGTYPKRTLQPESWRVPWTLPCVSGRAGTIAESE